MSDTDSMLDALREAVKLAPTNVSLANHLGKTVLGLMRYDEAEEIYKSALANTPDSPLLKLGMADAYYQQTKNSHAFAIVETLIQKGSVYPPALTLHAKLLYRAGDVQGAVFSYKQAIDLDEEAADPDLASLLGIQTWSEESSEDDFSELDSDEVSDGRVRMSPDSDSDFGESSSEFERPEIGFDSVGGMSGVKEEIQVKIIFPLQHASIYAAYGQKAGGGILMYGPPGCGKTHLARATAGEVESKFLSIGISDVLDMWIGNSERNLNSLFDQARRNRPCVMFFDEVDALGASRSDMRQSAGRHLVNQFLAEMDGAEADNEGLLILGATNAPWHVDAAFRRPGRFDRVIFVPPPDLVAREEILKILMEGKPAEDVRLDKIAAKTAEYSGADLKAVIDTAIEGKLREAIKTGRPSPLTTKDLLGAVKRVKSSTKEWFATARNHALYSNQGGTYDDILHYLKIK